MTTAATPTRVAVLVGSLRSESVQPSHRRVAVATQAPEGVEEDIIDGLAAVPFYNEDVDGADVPATAASCARASRAPTACSR